MHSPSFFFYLWLLCGVFMHLFSSLFCVAHVCPDIDRFYFGSSDIPSLLATKNMTQLPQYQTVLGYVLWRQNVYSAV